MEMIETLASIITAPEQHPWAKSCFLSFAYCRSYETDIGICQACLEALYSHTIAVISPGMAKGIMYDFLPGIENNFINNKWTLFINKSNNLCVIAPYKVTNTEEFCANYGFKNLTKIESAGIDETMRTLPYVPQAIQDVRESIDINNPNHPTRFLLDGHGATESHIANLAAKSFGAFLKLLTDLNAEFLYINSCGIAGKNLLTIQNQIKAITAEKSSFNCHIAIQGTSDNDSFGCVDTYNLFKNLDIYFEQISHKGYQNKVLLASLLQKVAPSIITDLISLRLGGPASFFRAIQMKPLEIITWLRLQRIQFACLYTAILAKNKFQQLSPIAAKETRVAAAANEGLIIPIKPDITCIQMYPQNALNFTFELKGQKPPCFVSKIPGPAQHFLGKITYSSPEDDPQKVLHTLIEKCFAQVFGEEVKNQSNKCWLIKSLELTANGIKSLYDTVVLYIEGKTGTVPGDITTKMATMATANLLFLH